MLRKNITGKTQIFSTATGMSIIVPDNETFDDSKISGNLNEQSYPILDKTNAIKQIIKVADKREKRIHFIIQSFGTNLFYLNACLSYIQEYAANIVLLVTPFNKEPDENRIKTIQSVISKKLFNAIDIIDTTLYPYNEKDKKTLMSDLVVSLGIQPNDIVFKIQDSDVFYEFEKSVSRIKTIPPGEHTWPSNVYWKSPVFMGWKEKRNFIVAKSKEHVIKYLSDESIIVDQHFTDIVPLQSFTFVNSISYIKKFLEHKKRNRFYSNIDLEKFISLYKATDIEKINKFVSPFKDSPRILYDSPIRIDMEGYKPLIDKINFVYSYNSLSIVLPILDVKTTSDESLFEFLHSFVINLPSLPVEVILLSTAEFAESRLKHVLKLLQGYSIKIHTFQYEKEQPFNIALNNIMLKTKSRYIALIDSYFVLKDNTWFNRVKEAGQKAVFSYSNLPEKAKVKDTRMFIYPRNYFILLGFSQGNTMSANIRYLYKSANLLGFSSSIVNNLLVDAN